MPAQGPIPLPSTGPQSVGRLVIQSLCSPAWVHAADSATVSTTELESQVLQTVLNIRLAAQQSNCAVCITCPAGMCSPGFQLRLQHLCDAVLSFETISDDSELFQLLPDAASAAALLHMRRAPGGGLVRQVALDEVLYVVRHKRRAISFTAVEVDPDAEAKQQDNSSNAGSNSSSKTAAGLLCGGPPAATRAFDF